MPTVEIHNFFERMYRYIVYRFMVSNFNAGIEEESKSAFHDMSEEDFVQWFQKRGVSLADCNTLTSKEQNLNIWPKATSLFLLSTGQGVTPAGFTVLDAEDFEGLGLSKIGKRLVVRALQEVKQ